MNIRDQLIRDEGLQLKVYRCPAGKLSVGVGRNLQDRGITQAEALYLLDNDVEDFTARLIKAMPWTQQLDGARFGVLVNMAFNMGVDGLTRFKQMLTAMEAGEWGRAAQELLNSVYAQQVPGRAKRLAQQLITGDWQ